MRTLNDALDRAKSLRDFKESSPDRFEKCNDFIDLVLLADEVERLNAEISRNVEVALDAIRTASHPDPPE